MLLKTLGPPCPSNRSETNLGLKDRFGYTKSFKNRRQFQMEIGALFVPESDRDLSGRGAARAEDAQGTPTQSHISPSILVYEDKGYVVYLVMHDSGFSGGTNPARCRPHPVTNPAADQSTALSTFYLRILVYLVIHDYGYVSLEHLLLSWYPAVDQSTARRHTALAYQAIFGMKSHESHFPMPLRIAYCRSYGFFTFMEEPFQIRTSWQVHLRFSWYKF